MSLGIEHNRPVIVITRIDILAHIIDKSIVARKGDGEHYQASFETPIHAGTEFKLLQQRGTWWHIEVPDGRKCWIPGASAELI